MLFGNCHYFFHWSSVATVSYTHLDVYKRQGLSGEAMKNCVKFVTNLYNAYVGLDCGMLEINPLFKTSDEKIIAVDCKMNIDDNALIRKPDVAALRDCLLYTSRCV